VAVNDSVTVLLPTSVTCKAPTGSGGVASGCASSRNTSRRPPVIVFPSSAGTGFTAAVRRARMAARSRSGSAERSSASAPETMGADIEVPLSLPY
jgi:hypothetical protein